MLHCSPSAITELGRSVYFSLAGRKGRGRRCMSGGAFGLAMYVVPLLALPFALRFEPAGRWPSLFALFIAPLVGSTTYLIVNRRFSVSMVAAAYPFAFLSLAFWAALLAVLGTRGLSALGDRLGCGFAGLATASSVSGAAIGSCFMVIFVSVARLVEPGGRSDDLLPYVLSGLMAGAVVGIFAAHYLISRRARAGRM